MRVTEDPVESSPKNGSAALLVGRLRDSFDAGHTRPLWWRRRQLEAMQRLLVDRESELLGALARDLGKPGIEGWVTELRHVGIELSEILRQLDRWTRPEKVRVRAMLRPAKATIVPEPLGVVLVIAPWNYPIQLLLLPMAYAIAGGNAVVGKPSEISASTSSTLAKLLPEYLDRDAIAIVEGDATVVTDLLAERWDHILYTGNGKVGRIVMEAAAKHLTPVTLELGGKSPAIVDRRANIGVAAKRVAWGKFLNAGQTCIAPDYVLVDKEVEPQFVDALVKAVHGFYGDDPKSSADYPRIVNQRHWDRVNSLVENRKDAQVALGGSGDRESRYFAPTVLRSVTWDEPVMNEEIFGPILPVVAVEDTDEAIDVVNAHDKPLALYVFSEDQAVVDKVVSHTSSGAVGANVTLLHAAVPDLPFGGVGASGMGAYHGKAGFDTFTHRKPFLQRPSRPDPPVTYPPYSKLKQRLIRKVF